MAMGLDSPSNIVYVWVDDSPPLFASPLDNISSRRLPKNPFCIRPVASLNLALAAFLRELSQKHDFKYDLLPFPAHIVGPSHTTRLRCLIKISVNERVS